jgi:hypothetical protein
LPLIVFKYYNNRRKINSDGFKIIVETCLKKPSATFAKLFALFAVKKILPQRARSLRRKARKEKLFIYKRLLVSFDKKHYTSHKSGIAARAGGINLKIPAYLDFLLSSSIFRQ